MGADGFFSLIRFLLLLHASCPFSSSRRAGRASFVYNLTEPVAPGCRFTFLLAFVWPFAALFLLRGDGYGGLVEAVQGLGAEAPIKPAEGKVFIESNGFSFGRERSRGEREATSFLFFPAPSTPRKVRRCFRPTPRKQK